MSIERVRELALAVAYDVGPFGSPDGLASAERMIESVRQGWTEDERDQLAEWALRRLVPQWREERHADELRAAAAARYEQRKAHYDRQTSMQIAWDQEVSPDRTLAIRNRLVAGEPVETLLGEPSTDGLRDWLLTREGRRYADGRLERIVSSAENAALFARAQRDLIREIKAEFAAEWTADLLAGRFVMPSGQVVSWGSASIEQHQVRARILVQQAGASIETMKRHEAATKLLLESGAVCLNDAVAHGQ